MIKDEFSEKLTGDLRKKYLDEKRNIMKELGGRHDKEFNFFRDTQNQEIEKDGRHRNLINSCVAPFTQNGSMYHTGYRYIRAAPLFEIGVKNFDFLLFNRNKSIAIFGECKGTISNPAALISDIEKQKKAVQGNMNLVKMGYLKMPETSNIDVEYVLAVPSNYSQEVVNAVVKSDTNLIVWHAPLTEADEISMAHPPSDSITDMRRMLHRDNELNGMSHVKSNRKIFSYFPQGHIVTKLHSLMSSLHYESSGVNISKELLREVISKDLFYAEEKVDQTVDALIAKAIEIGFLDPNTDGNMYKIKSNTRKADKLEAILQEKWIMKQFENKQSDAEETKVDALRKEIQNEIDKQQKL